MYCPACRSEYPPDWKACPKDATALLKSAHIGKYRVDGLLGVGGMGAVYRATNPDIQGARVAIKVMNPAVAGADATRERFKREAAAVAALRTAHVVQVYDFDSDADGALYLVMELLDGHPLRDEITAGPQYMELARVQMVMEGALKGLAAAHRAGIVHRDLKPENIFIADTDDGEVPKLLDFGIARVKSTDKHLTHTGSLMGTASYMAIEQVAANAGEIGPWTDVYAMGAILYEMLAGAPAYGGNTITEVLQRVLQAERVPLASVREGLPAAIYELVDRCMSTTPAERPQSAEALRDALRRSGLVHPGGTVPPPHRTRPEPPRAPSPGDRSDIGVMVTEGRHTPLPPELSAQAPRLGNGTAPSIPPTTPAIAHGTASGTASVAPAARRAVWPFLLAGAVVVGGGAFAIAKLSGGSSGSVEATAPRPDADVAAVVDALVVANVIDAAPVVLPETHAHMIEIPGGAGTIGLPGATGGWLAATEVAYGGFFLDDHEVTRGEVEATLAAHPALALHVRTAKERKDARDAASTPARYVTYEDAAKLCEAQGKRLPTEIEWEIAARTTPNLAARARLLRKDSEADLSAPSTDCSEGGLCDMLGGVSEWTATDGKAAGTKIVRGASYRDRPGGKLDTIHQRQTVPVGESDNTIGFRCAVTPRGSR